MYYTTSPEPQERVRDMDTLQPHIRSRGETDFCDACKSYATRRDFKHKWVQTEDFDQGKNLVDLKGCDGFYSTT